MTGKATTVHYGQVGFGTIYNFPPARWRYVGRRCGAYAVEHVKPAAQSVAYPDQYVSLRTLLNLMSEGDK